VIQPAVIAGSISTAVRWAVERPGSATAVQLLPPSTVRHTALSLPTTQPRSRSAKCTPLSVVTAAAAAAGGGGGRSV